MAVDPPLGAAKKVGLWAYFGVRFADAWGGRAQENASKDPPACACFRAFEGRYPVMLGRLPSVEGVYTLITSGLTNSGKILATFVQILKNHKHFVFLVLP